MVKSRKQTLTINLVLAGLILITYFIYFPPFADAFVGDDYIQFDYIKEFLHRPFAAIQLFNPYHLSWYYRPIQNIWFLLNRLILGLNPFGYYVVQLPLHALAVALVYRVGRRFKLSPLAAVCSAAIFAIHSHHVDVVTWISSVAIVMAAVFSLLALNSWLGYLKRPSNKHLFLTLLFCLLTILSHEEGILLLPFLFLMMVMWRLEMRDWKLKDWAKTISKKESIIFLLLFVIFIGYLVIQLTRPNVTLDITARSSGEWFDYLAWAEIAEFILVTVFRFTFAFPVLSLSGIPAELFVIAVLALFGWWAWRGSLVVRLGLAWTAVHLFFIYWALWTNLPTLYAGRHIYQAGIGLVLAIGAGIDGLLGIGDWRLEIKKPFNLQSPISNLVIIFFVVAAALHHINQTRESQEIWVNNATEEKVAEAQLKEILPQISEADHIFSYRFPIAPDFTRAVAQLWYDVPLSRPGGGLDHLRAYGRATRHFYLFDYEEGQVYNLMPELQAHDETIFLWAGSSQTEVLGNGRFPNNRDSSRQ
jgi:hypothetical protein